MNESAATWWSARRKRYNVGLVVSGVAAFVTYGIVMSVFSDLFGDPGAEMSIFSIAFMGAGYLVCMAIANLCYLLGPLSERLLRPRNPPNYRRVAFALGFWFSVALPFIIPAWLTWMALFHADSLHD